jgi:hypothetical protein
MALGIEVIHGVPVEQRIALPFGVKKVGVIKQAFTDHPELLGPLEEYPTVGTPEGTGGA